MSDTTTGDDTEVRVQRARIEEIRDLADEYRREQEAASGDGRPSDVPLPSGGIYWLARDADGTKLGYAAGTMRPIGCQIGPVFTRAAARRRGVGNALLTAIQGWAEDTRVPVVEISVAADNPSGQAFLESLGYVPRRVLMSLTPQQGQRGDAR
ncbi:GNAT family N-acetyltransferase [Nitriliruptor alkaliphilus]|uniref:GNAT family N-acetyltransferase n=1 Tax=Nitriliruptor alkaliphilus TaxID=427918 RepID=UPI000696361B|nr:GNAT family N-acetyltransferase [Nitriliruptor alkaliphilus]